MNEKFTFWDGNKNSEIIIRGLGRVIIKKIM